MSFDETAQQMHILLLKYKNWFCHANPAGSPEAGKSGARPVGISLMQPESQSQDGSLRSAKKACG